MLPQARHERSRGAYPDRDREGPDGRIGDGRAAIALPFIVVTLIWGSTWLVIRDQITAVPALWSVAYRFLIAGAAMAGVALARRERFPDDGPTLAFAGAIGVAQFTGNYSLVYAAEAHVTSGLVAVVFALLLLPNAVLGRLVLGQRLGGRVLAGSAVATAGVAMLIAQEARAGARGPHETLVGVALAAAAVLAASCANVAQGTALARRTPMTSTLAASMLVGAGVDAALAWASSGPPVILLQWRYLAGLAYLALAGSALAFSLYYRVLRAVGAARGAYVSMLVPVVAMLLSTLFEGYRWSTLAAGGAVLTGMGLIVALSARRPAR